MSKLQATTTQTQTTEVELTQSVRAHLAATLDTIKELRFQIDALVHLCDIEKLTVQAIMDEAGVDKMELDGFNMNVVRGTTSTLDKAKLYAQGVTQAMVEAATVIRPKKPYLTIRAKGEKGDTNG